MECPHMVSQVISFTKSLLTKSFAFRNNRLQRLAMVTALVMLTGWQISALALVKMESRTIDAALVYGMQNQKYGLANLLGPNWIEGENGALLNVYSPFMMLATKAAKAGLSSNPGKSDLKKARNRFGRDVAFYADPKNRLQVKFAVSFYGNTPDFAKTYMARIVGFGRGKEFELKPIKQILDQKADPVQGGVSGAAYEAINSYYFNFAELEDLQEFKLVLQSPSGPPLEFRMKNERLY
jgi:hypothetical protein